MANRFVLMLAAIICLGASVGCSGSNQSQADVVDLKAKPTMPPPTASAGGAPAKPAATAQMKPQ